MKRVPSRRVASVVGSHKKFLFLMGLLTGAYDLIPDGGEHAPHVPHRHRRIVLNKAHPIARIDTRRYEPINLDVIFLCGNIHELLALATIWNHLLRLHVSFRILTVGEGTLMFQEMLQRHCVPYALRHRVLSLPSITRQWDSIERGKIPERYIHRMSRQYLPRICVAGRETWFQRSLSSYYQRNGSQEISIGVTEMEGIYLERNGIDRIMLNDLLYAQWQALSKHYSPTHLDLPHCSSNTKWIILMLPMSGCDLSELLHKLQEEVPECYFLLYAPRPYLLELPAIHWLQEGSFYLCDSMRVPLPLICNIAFGIVSWRQGDLLLGCCSGLATWHLEKGRYLRRILKHHYCGKEVQQEHEMRAREAAQWMLQ
jgi:hypothetical protein